MDPERPELMPSQAQLNHMNDFSKAVVKALNDCKVACSNRPWHYAVFTIVGNYEDRSSPPCGGSVNYDRDKGVWEFIPEVSLASPVDELDS